MNEMLLRRMRWLSLGLACGLVVASLAVVLLRSQLQSAPSAGVTDAVGDFGPAPAWTLTDQQGRQVRSDAFGGKLVIADFIYTHCTDICPQLSLQMQALQEELRAEGLLGTEVQLLSFTTDPARDTPGVLRPYAARHRADPDAWRFLTGPEGVLVPLIVEGFRLGVTVLPPTSTAHEAHADSTAHYEVMHSGRFVLIDRRGRIRAYYDGEAFDPKRVVRDLRELQDS
jgi:protein SCO1